MRPRTEPASGSSDAGHDARREAIRRIVRLRAVGTQEELRARLAREGFDVTQATLSRDLARLRARRVTLAEGGTVYELDEAKAPEGDDELSAMREMVVSVSEGEALVVIHTTPGAASAVALVLDRARLPGVLGTIAGDDTIFVAPVRGTPAARVNKKLKDLWKKGERT